MWIVFACGSALFAGITSILAKIGLKNVDSNLATALRTIVVTLFAWLMVFVLGEQASLGSIPQKSAIFLVLSGLATGTSWLCYFRALQDGDVNKVVPIDKSSTILTILLSLLLLGEKVSLIRILAIVTLAIGIWLMIERKDHAVQKNQNSRWLWFALLSAVFAGLSAILGKVGIEDVPSTLGTALRTMVVLVMAWVIVLVQHKGSEIKYIPKKSWLFIGLSGLATGLSWLCYYRALQDGPISIVVPIDKLSILPTIAFGYFILGEKLSKKALIGLCLMVVSTLLLLI